MVVRGRVRTRGHSGGWRGTVMSLTERFRLQPRRRAHRGPGSGPESGQTGCSVRRCAEGSARPGCIEEEVGGVVERARGLLALGEE